MSVRWLVCQGWHFRWWSSRGCGTLISPFNPCLAVKWPSSRRATAYCGSAIGSHFGAIGEFKAKAGIDGAIVCEWNTCRSCGGSGWGRWCCRLIGFERFWQTGRIHWRHYFRQPIDWKPVDGGFAVENGIDAVRVDCGIAAAEAAGYSFAGRLGRAGSVWLAGVSRNAAPVGTEIIAIT